MESTKYLFIYGTLLPEISGRMSKWLAKNSEVICHGSIPGYLYLISDYPAAIYDNETSDYVQGLIVELQNKEDCFSLLDAYEGKEYLRTINNVTGKDSIERTCWMYLYNRPINNLQLILTGNYVEFVKTRKS